MAENLTAEDISVLTQCSLFQGVDNREVKAMMNCLGARFVDYRKDEVMLRQGDEVHSVGVVISGSALVTSQDFWGNTNVMTRILPAGMFAESFACIPNACSSVYVQALSPTRVAYLDVARIVETCSSSCTFHTHLVRNLLTIMARKNHGLMKKTEHITKRTTREKVLSYLSACSQDAMKNEFDIPFNRQQLADYLSVERSALSSTLSKMQAEGLISYHKNHFVLLQG